MSDANIQAVLYEATKACPKSQAIKDGVVAIEGMIAEITRLRERCEAFSDAAKWVLHVAHGCGRGGGAVEPGEETAALDALKAAFENKEPDLAD